jgi:hypothetical protein
MKLRVCVLSLAVLFVTTFAYAQGGATSSISGVVVDSNGGVIPGASSKRAIARRERCSCARRSSRGSTSA